MTLPGASDVPDSDARDMVQVGAFSIFQAVSAMFSDRVVLAGNCDWQFNDKFYGLPSHEQLMEIVPLLPADPLEYVLGFRECDDFTRIDRGWLSYVGLGTATFADVHIQIFDDSGYIGWHECLLVGTTSGERYFLEPQTNLLYSINDPCSWIHPEATHALIDAITF